MLIIHRVINCLHCGVKLEVFDDEVDARQKDCPVCGYSNELDDIRVSIREEEW